MKLHFHLLNNKNIDQSINQDIFVIGRSAKCDVIIPHEGMSRQHCQIEVKNGEVFVTDLGSTNGVWIDGQRIEPHRKTLYATYLTLAFGAVQSLQIQLDETTGSLNTHAYIPKKDIGVRELPGTSITAMTKTKNLPDFSKVPVSAPLPLIQPEPPKYSRFQSMLINFTALLILASAVWWYVQKTKKKVNYNEDHAADLVDPSESTYEDSGPVSE